MNIDEVKQLISLINESDIKNFEYAFDGGVVRISKNDGGFMAPSPAPAAMPVPSPMAVPAPVSAAMPVPVAAAEEQPKAKSETKDGNKVKAPIVGTFYESAGPGKAPFVTVGSKVKKGDVLCIIEAMKIMNEVVSEFDGEVVEILVENEQLVEYGQPLFVIA